MEDLFAGELQRAWAALLHFYPELLAFRFMPIFAYALTRVRPLWIRRACYILGGAALVSASTLVEQHFSVRSIVLCYAYASVAASGTILLKGVLAASRLRAAAWSLVCGIGVPALVTTGPLRIFAIVIGWDFAFKAFSYVVDAKRENSPPDAIFFFLVDPTLVYPQRAIAAPAQYFAGAGRCLFGVLCLGLGGMAAEASITRALPGLPEVGRPFVAGLQALLSIYAMHSGLASLQIGALRGLGHRARERYDFPFLASSPLEFWRRWNTYVGEWYRRYVFYPLVTTFMRRFRNHAALPLVKPAAVIATFIAVGVAHDLATAGKGYGVRPFSTIVFALSAVFALLWYAFEAALSDREHVAGASSAIARVPGRAAVLVLAISIVRFY